MAMNHLAGFLIVAFAANALPHTPGAADQDVSGVVFLDANGNGTRDPSERGLAGVAVSNQVDVVVTGQDGGFHLDPSHGYGIVFVSVPDGYRAVGAFWHHVEKSASAPVSFALAKAPAPTDFTFVHASDTHLSEKSLPRTQRLKALVDSLKPAFVLVSGDLVRDALRVSEAEATGYYEMYIRETARFSAPLWNVPGNHEIFGIERMTSLVSPSHPLYAKAMYRHYLGPDYYSFTFGGIHFVGLNSVDYDDLWYYGHVDSTQIEWLKRDLETVPATTPVVTFNHIPFLSTAEQLNGYTDDPPAPSLITVNHHTSFRHTVSNAAEVIAALKGHPYPLALGGHIHMRESIEYEIAGRRIRFHQAAAVVGPTDVAGLTMPSGITLYKVRAGQIDDGTFVPLDSTPVGTGTQ
jgi:calcineurin-like phosphoesterase family protein